MKTLFFYTIICCLFSAALTAQNTIKGKVLFLASDKTPAVGVEISGHIKGISSAKPVYTAEDGSFTLVFPKATAGKQVRLNIGDTDGKDQALEIVNQEEINILRIPEHPENEFEIIVCKKGARDLVAQRYYKIFKSSADRELKKKKMEWASLLEQKEKDFNAITKLREKIDQLEKQTDSLPIYRETYRMASINKDNASKSVLKYFELLDEGKSVQEAREAVNIEKAIEELKKSATQFKIAIEELGIFSWASKYNTMGMVCAKNKQFKEAYAIFIEYEKRFPNEEMAYRNWAMYYALQNEKEKAVRYLQKAVELGYNDVKWLHTDDSMDSLRGEKAFIELLKKLEQSGKK